MNKNILKIVLEIIIALSLAIGVYVILPCYIMINGTFKIVFAIIVISIFINYSFNKENEIKIGYAISTFICSTFLIGISQFVFSDKYPLKSDELIEKCSPGKYYIIEKNNIKRTESFSYFKPINGKILEVTYLADNMNHTVSVIGESENDSLKLLTFQGYLTVCYNQQWGHILYGSQNNVSYKDSIENVVKLLLHKQVNAIMKENKNINHYLFERHWKMGATVNLKIEITNLPKEVMRAYYNAPFTIG